MYIDKRLEFSDAQALTATAASTNVINLGSDRDIGPGRPLWVVIQLDVAANAADGDETYSFALETDDNSDFSSATVLETITIARGSAAGTRKVIAIPNANEQYLRLNYTLAGTTPSVTVSAWVTDQEPQSWQALADGI